ncbi:glycosyltransferase family 2 protein [Microbacterium mangrovi]|uniref:glycosyltransferase family 2 protein n=1 Tax=Microbacterium mangrovi TaxID=1348253 RepID=UPI00068AFAF6|nr:glycosyltransferase family 2 protein [Microbacterium mangrovi]
MTTPPGPAVTVIVPGYDVAPYVPEALASLRAQTRTDWRAILVDDASTDGTGALFDAAAAEDDRFQVIHHDRRRGLSAARNSGLELVETPFVGFLDADDRMRPTALARLVGTIERTGSDAVAGAYVRLRPTASGEYSSGEVQPWVAAATAPERTATSLAEHPDASGNIVAWSKVSRMDLWHRTGLRFPDGRLYEDQIVAQQLYTHASAFDVIPDVVVEWRERADGSSITQGKDTLPVLREYLAALRAGIEVLQHAGMADAVASRVRLIRAMDLPPLAAIAETHPDPAYAAELRGFTEWLSRVLPAD